MLSIKEAAEIFGTRARNVSDDIRDKLPAYFEFLKTLARLGKNISLDSDNGILKIREDFVNDCLNELSIEDQSVRSIRLSCADGHASFLIEFKKLFFDGVIDVPFAVEGFIFNKERRVISFRFGNKKLDRVNNYYSKVLFWFSLSVIRIFKKKDGITKSFFDQDSLTVASDGTHTIDLNKVPDIRELFNRDMVNLRYWDLVSMDRLSFEKGMITLRFSHKLSKIMKTCIGVVEVLPKGSLIRPLLNRF